jgi:hypothetical protein
MSVAIRAMASELRMRVFSDIGVMLLLAFPLILAGALMVISRGTIRDELFQIMFLLEVLMLPPMMMHVSNEFRHLYGLPVSSSRLAVARLVVDASAIFLLSLVTSLTIMLMCSQSDWPIFRLALFVASITPMWTAIRWGFRQSQGCQILGGFVSAVALLGFLLYLVPNGNLSQAQPFSPMNDGAWLILATGSVFAICGSLLTYHGVRRDRYGEGWRLPEALRKLAAWRTNTSVLPTASPAEALIWFQRSFVGASYVRVSLGFLLVTAVSGILWFPGGVYSFPSENWPNVFLGVLIVEYVLFAWLGGLRCATTEETPGNKLQTIFANVPVTDQQMAVSTMIAGMKSVIPATLLMVFAHLLVGIVFRSATEPISFIFRESSHFVALGFQLIVVIFLGWVMFSNCFWTWLTGKPTAFLGMLVVTATSIYSGLAPVLLGRIGEYIRDGVNACLLIGLFLFSLWMVRRARQMKFVDQRTIRKLIVGWLLVYVLAVACLWLSDSVTNISIAYRWPWPVRSLIAAGLASLAILPIPASRMAIYWNRHQG